MKAMMNTIKTFALSAVALFALCLSAQAIENITIAPGGFEKFYDGTTNMALTAVVQSGTLAKGDRIDQNSIVFAGYFKDAGTNAVRIANYSAKIVDKDGKDMSAYYNIAYGQTNAVVKPRAITLTSGSAEKPYDGKPLKNDSVYVMSEFAKDEGATYTVTGSQTDVGASSNTFTYVFNQGTDSNNYVVTKFEGELKVTTADSITVTLGKECTAPYSGTTTSNGLYVSSYTVDLPGFVALVNAVCTNKNVGTYAPYGSAWSVAPNITIMKGPSDVTRFFKSVNLNTNQANALVIAKRPVTLASASATKIYDGTPLTTNKVTTTGLVDWADGEGATYTVTGSQTAVGESANTFSYTLKEGTSEDNYNITTNCGKLVVLPLPPTITIVADSTNFVYTGAAQSCAGYKVLTNGVLCVDGILEGGRKVTAVTSGSVTNTTDLGAKNTIKEFWVKDGETVVTDQYKILTESGDLKVTARPITVQFFDTTYTYDGEASYPTNAIVAGSLAANEGLVTTWKCDPIDAGVYVCTNDTDWVTNAVGENVGYNYAFTLANTNALVQITKRPVTLSSASAEQFYDETALSTNVVEVTDGSMAEGEEFKYIGWQPQMKVGRYDNTFIAVDNDPAKTNNYAITYDYGTLLIKAKRAAYDLKFGDFTNEVTYWNEGLGFSAAKAPIREGYKFVYWTNSVDGTIYKPNDYVTTSDKVYILEAVWVEDPAYVVPEIPETSQYDDKIIDVKTYGGGVAVMKKEATRDVVITNDESSVADCIRVLVRIQAPLSTDEKVAPKIAFKLDGKDIAQGTWSDLFLDCPQLSEVTKHDSTREDPNIYYFVDWIAYVRPGQLNEALQKNKVGEAYATTKLYCDWNNDGEFDNAYTVRFNADTCTVKGKVPAVANITWVKGYLDTATKSKVNEAAWSNATQVTVWTNTVDLLDKNKYGYRYDLPRTGYTHKGWVPANTRGLVPMTKDVTLAAWELPIVAQWETNTYTAVFTNELKYADGFKVLFKGPTLTNGWTVEDLDLDLPGKHGVKAKYYKFDTWTNETGKAFDKITVADIGTNEVDTFTFWAKMDEKQFKVRYNLTNEFANIYKEGTPYQALANNITRYTVSTNGGEKIAMADASCFGCKFEGWTPSAVIDPLAGSNMTFTAKWTEYQAMVVDGLTMKTNYFTSVAEAVAAITNSGTTIAFLDAKGDGINNPCQIKIGDNLKDITINFCALDYTNATEDAAILIGTNSEVAVTSVPGYIGETTKLAPARLVQLGGNAVKVGEGSTFTLDDAAITLDVVVDKESKKYEDAKELFENGNWRIARITPNTFRGHDMAGEGTGIFKFYTALMEETETNINWNAKMVWDSPVKGVTFHKQGSTQMNVLTNMLEATNYFVKVTNDYWTAKAAYEAANGAAIYAPSNATLVLKAGNIGAKAYGEANKCAAIDWVGQREYLNTNTLFFATQPLQKNGIDLGQFAGTESQVAEGCIWTTEGVDNAEFPYTVTKLGSVVADLDEIYITDFSFKKPDGNEAYGMGGSVAQLYNDIKDRIDAGYTTCKWTAAEPSLSQDKYISCDAALVRTAPWTNGTCNVVTPGGTILSTNVTFKGTLLVGASNDITNGIFKIMSPAGVCVTNFNVCACRYRSGDALSYADKDSATFKFGFADNHQVVSKVPVYITNLVETLENKQPTNLWVKLDWDGAAGVSNWVTYVVNYDAYGTVISNQTEQLFPYVGKITYVQRPDFEFIDTNALRSTYTIFDTTTNAQGVVLEPAIGGIYTNDVAAYRFDGWYTNETCNGEIVTNLVHVKGAGQDVKDQTFYAGFTPLVWATNACTVAGFATVQDAINALPNGGDITYLGGGMMLSKPMTISGKSKYTINFNGKNVVKSYDGFYGDYLIEVMGGDVTITNANITATTTVYLGQDEAANDAPGGIRASNAATLTLADNVSINTYGTMLCADTNSFVTADAVRFAMDLTNAAVKAINGATLVFTNMVDNEEAEWYASYKNVVFASNATFRATMSKMQPDVGGEFSWIGDAITVITAVDGAKVYVDNGAKICNTGDKPTILAKNAYVEINDGADVENFNGNVVVSLPADDGKVSSMAGVTLNGGQIAAMEAGAAVLHYAGTLYAPTNSTFMATTLQSTIVIDNKYGVLDRKEGIKLWGGLYKSVTGDALRSENSTGERLEKFMTCAFVPGVKGALFSTGVNTAFCADGYIPCEDSEVIPTMDITAAGGKYIFWHFIKTEEYMIDYDLDGGTREKGDEVWKTSYNVETGMILLPSNTVKKAHFVFGGWSISNTVTGVVRTGMVIEPGVDFGNLALKAIWNVDNSMVYVDYQGEDGYPRYYYMYDAEGGTNYWFPSTRYPYWNYKTASDEGVVVSPAKTVKFAAPEYMGYKFRWFEDAENGRRYSADTEYGVTNFTFDAENHVHLRAVWTSNMAVYDDEGRSYKTIADAVASATTTNGMTLRVMGKGTAYDVDKTIVIDKNITLDLNGKQLVMSDPFVGDTFVLITNALEAAVVNGTISANVGTDSIRVMDADGAAARTIDSSWELKTTVQIKDDYIVEGFECVQDEKTNLWSVQLTVYTLTFNDGITAESKRPDLKVALNNEAASYTKNSDPIFLNDPERAGYVFAGWFDDDGKPVVGKFDPAGKTSSTTLTAKWNTKTYKVSYVIGEGAGLKPGVVEYYTAESGEFELNATNTAERAGYELASWQINGEAKMPWVVKPLEMTDKTAPALGDLTAVAVWKASCYKFTFNTLGGKAISDLLYNEELMKQGNVVIPVPSKAGSKFVKWVDKQGQTVPTGEVTACFSADLTAVWEKSLWTDGTVVGGNTQKPCTTFNGGVNYTGVLLDADGNVAAKVTVTATKPNTKGVSTVTLTTGKVLGEGKAYTLKNSTVDVSKGVQDVELTNTAKDKAVVTISDNGVEGTFGDDYKIIASADRFATNVTKIPAATLAYLQGNWTVAFTNATFGAATLKLAVAAKGKVTVTGNLPDGTAVSQTSQLVYGDGVCVCTIVVNAYKDNKGGFAFDLWFGTTGVGDNLVDETEVVGLTKLTTNDGEIDLGVAGISRVAENAAKEEYTFKVDLGAFELPEGVQLIDYVSGDDEVSIEANAQTGKLTVPATTTVSINATTGKATWKNPDCENKLGLALTYTKSTGALTGSIKVYATVQNAKTGKYSLKTYTAKVYGVMTGDFACCTATEKTIGSAPAGLE